MNRPLKNLILLSIILAAGLLVTSVNLFTSEETSEEIGKYQYYFADIKVNASLVKANGKFMLTQTFSDGGGPRQIEVIEIQESGESRLVHKTGRVFGEYYRFHENGDLGIYDEEGFITTMRRIK